jgi:hypothetical protein
MERGQSRKLPELVVADVQRSLGDEINRASRNQWEPVLLESLFDDLVAHPLRRYRHHLPADQLEALVLQDDAFGHHLPDLGDAPAPPRHTFGSLCRRGQRAGAKLLVHAEP